MPGQSGQVVLIIGASSGIGAACASYLHARGYRVFGTSRRPSEVPIPSFPLLAMDVDDDTSVRHGIAEVLAVAGRIDVVVNNAGIAIAGAVEETSDDEARAQLETNLFGVLRVCRALLPIMRQQRGGTIVNISSVAGTLGVPFQGLYSASKFAVEGLSEALWAEARPFGIRVVVIAPGDFPTAITTRRRLSAQAQFSDVYRERCARALAIMATDEAHGPSPMRVARLLERIIVSPAPRLHYTIGPLPEHTAVLLKRLLPRALVARLLMHYYRIN